MSLGSPKVAWLFPGQGAESPRMGLEVAARWAGARALRDQVAALLGLDVELLLRRGGRALERTEVLQPVMTAVSLGAVAALRAAGLEPAVVAGHSLGEVAACAAAGYLRADEAVRVAAERGRLMAEAAVSSPGGLVALSCNEVEARRALVLGSAHGALALAAHNAPDEWVLAGDERALRAVQGTNAVRLRVAGPWHSPAMASAARGLAEPLAAVSSGHATIPLLSGASGTFAPSDTSLVALLAEPLTRPLRWVEVMASLRAHGIDTIVTCGPGKVLRSLCRRNLGPGVRVLGTETAAELDDTLDALLGRQHEAAS